MSGTALRDALHEVASVGAGPVDDARLARIADRAKGGEALTAPRRGGRRRWVVGGLAVAAVGVLVFLGMGQALRPIEVTPASGPGSLPDQIFPTREHILTMEQAPIGRVSMVFEGPLLDGATSWVAIGADSDEYRALAPSSAPLAFTEAIDVSPDGSSIVVGHDGRSSGSLQVEFIDASTGQSSFVTLPDDGAGGDVDTLSWSLSGDQVAVLANVTNAADPDLTSGRSRYYIVDMPSGNVTELPSEAVLAGEIAGWTPEGDLVLVDGPGTSGPSAGRLVVSVASQSGVTRLATLSWLQLGFSQESISPDGRLLAGVVDATPSSFGDGSVSDLQVYNLATGKQVLGVHLSSYVGEESSVIGWRNATTPVLSAARPGEDGPGLLVAYDVSTGAHDVIVRAGVKGVPRYYGTSRVASNILGSGEVREAQPPAQPWYDPRTLVPAMRDWILDHKALGVLGVILLAGVAVFGVSRRRRARSVVEVHG